MRVADSPVDRGAFVRAQTVLDRLPLLPELPLQLATEAAPLLLVDEQWLGERGVPPPFWAFAWAGGQALARYLLDHPEEVAGRTVLDYATGSGLCAIAAARAGARRVIAVDRDPFAVAAAELNAAANGVRLELVCADLLGAPDLPEELAPADLILVGDALYEPESAGRFVDWLRRLARPGRRRLLGDPGRGHVPPGMIVRGRYEVPGTWDLERRDPCPGWVLELPE